MTGQVSVHDVLAVDHVRGVRRNGSIDDGLLDRAALRLERRRRRAAVWRGLGVGVAGTIVERHRSGADHRAIPHPINANQPRTLTGTADASHHESAIHLQAAYWFQRGAARRRLLSGGPSFMRVEQDFVSDVSYSQTFPYDTVTFESRDV